MSLQTDPLFITDLIPLWDPDFIHLGEPILGHLKNDGVDLMEPIDYTGLKSVGASEDACINSLLSLVGNNSASLSHTLEKELNHDWLRSAHTAHHHNDVCEDGHASDFLPSVSDVVAIQKEMQTLAIRSITTDEIVTMRWLLSTYLDEKTSACDKDMILQLLVTPSDLPAHTSQTVALVGTVPMDNMSAVL